jgi:hypothetical protein
MKKWEIKYTSWICIEVEAEDEDSANEEADRIINEMTGADFRDCTDWESTDELEENKNA